MKQPKCKKWKLDKKLLAEMRHERIDAWKPMYAIIELRDAICAMLRYGEITPEALAAKLRHWADLLESRDIFFFRHEE